jgi:hypothetical protein
MKIKGFPAIKTSFLSTFFNCRKARRSRQKTGVFMFELIQNIDINLIVPFLQKFNLHGMRIRNSENCPEREFNRS